MYHEYIRSKKYEWHKVDKTQNNRSITPSDPPSDSVNLISQQLEEIILCIATAYPPASMWKPAMLLFATCKLMASYQYSYFKYINIPLEFADQLMRYSRVHTSFGICHAMPDTLVDALRFIDKVNHDKSASNQLLEVIAVDKNKFFPKVTFSQVKLTILSVIAGDVVHATLSDHEKLIVTNINRDKLSFILADCLNLVHHGFSVSATSFEVQSRFDNINFHGYSPEYVSSILANYIINIVNYLFNLCKTPYTLELEQSDIARRCKWCRFSHCWCTPQPYSYTWGEIDAGRNMMDYFTARTAVVHLALASFISLREIS